MGVAFRQPGHLAAIAIAAVLPFGVATADTLPLALTLAYKNNPQIISQRAAVRASDEAVPQALSGYRPHVNLSASVAEQRLSTLTKTSVDSVNSPATYSRNSATTAVQSYGGTVTQTLLNGFGTASRTRQAEQLVSAARETLRTTEQNVLLSAAVAYINLIRDIATLDLQRRNVEVLEEQLRQTSERFKAGEVTATDVSQANPGSDPPAPRCWLRNPITKILGQPIDR